jgi:hypothetical protein
MTTSTAAIGHNSKPELTDEQRSALFLHHRRVYMNALAAKKTADANLKNAAKRAKAEGVDPGEIRFAIRLEANAEEEEARRGAEERIARWLQVPFGEQASLLDRTPGEDRAFAEGRKAGAEGKDRAIERQGRTSLTKRRRRSVATYDIGQSSDEKLS